MPGTGAWGRRVQGGRGARKALAGLAVVVGVCVVSRRLHRPSDAERHASLPCVVDGVSFLRGGVPLDVP